MRSETIDAISAALAKAQGEIEGATKSSENPHFRSKYADLGNVWDACRGPLTKNGLAIHQGVRGDGEMRLVTTILHASGQWIEDDGMPLLLDKQNMQGLGSALTYARRYGLMGAVGIAPEDDDGNAAVQGSGAEGRKVTVQRGKAKEKPQEKPQATPPGLLPVVDGLIVWDWMIEVPVKNDQPDWKGWAASIKAAINETPSVEDVNALMAANEAPLKNLGAESATALKHLTDAAEKRRGYLSQAAE